MYVPPGRGLHLVVHHVLPSLILYFTTRRITPDRGTPVIECVLRTNGSILPIVGVLLVMMVLFLWVALLKCKICSSI